MKEITLYTPQGIGDTFWIYQKFVNHVDIINFGIMSFKDTEVSDRALEFLSDLPKVGKTFMHKTDRNVMRKVINTRFDQNKTLGHKSTYYSCNKPLEDGIRLEGMDTHSVEWGIDIPCKSVDLPKDYILLYVSGNKAQYGWSASKWAHLTKSIWKKFNDKKLPIVTIGATYDMKMLKDIENLLRRNGMRVISKTNMPIKESTYIIKNATYMIGYQSGLSIIADNFDTKQLMVYFPHLEKMMYSWAKPENIDKGIYNPFIFTQLDRKTIDSIKI